MTLAKTVTTLAACGALAACGGAKTGGTVTYDPVAVSDGLLITKADDNLTRVFRSGTLISEPNDTKVGDADQLPGPVTIRRNSATDTVRAVNANIFAVASANQSFSGIGGAPSTNTAFGRFEADDLPQSGAAQMEGNYKGILVDNTVIPGSQFIFYYVEGRANIEANFEDGSITGTLSQRELVNATSLTTVHAPVQNFQLSAPEITPEGTFESGLFAVSLPQQNSPIAAVKGTIAGVFGNDPNNGPRVAGVVELEHAYGNGGTLTEVGAFSTDQSTVTP